MPQLQIIQHQAARVQCVRMHIKPTFAPESPIPPVTGLWPELRAIAGCPPTYDCSSGGERFALASSSGEAKPDQELVLSSGERPSQRSCDAGDLLSSCERMLAGAGCAVAGCPPAKGAWSEERTLSPPQLRLRQGSSELHLPVSILRLFDANRMELWYTLIRKHS